MRFNKKIDIKLFIIIINNIMANLCVPNLCVPNLCVPNLCVPNLCVPNLCCRKNKWQIYSERECTYPINHNSHIYPQLFTIVNIHNKVLYYYVIEFDNNEEQLNIYKMKTKDGKKILLKSKKLIMLCYDPKVDKFIKVVDKKYIAKKDANEYEVTAWLDAK